MKKRRKVNRIPWADAPEAKGKAVNILRTIPRAECKFSSSRKRYIRNRTVGLQALREATPSRLVVTRLDGTIVKIEDRLTRG